MSSLVADASIIVTSLIARAEMSAGINRLLGVNYISKDHYSIALRDFRSDWNHYERISVSEEIAGRADLPACEYSLRGYDATHLSCGLTWQDALELPVSLVSFDSELREAARKSGLQVLPE